MAVPCSLSAVARVIKGPSRSSSLLTDLTARLTNTAIAIIATAIIRKDKAMIAVMTTSQNNGSCVFIVRKSDLDLCALDSAFTFASEVRAGNEPRKKQKTKAED